MGKSTQHAIYRDKCCHCVPVIVCTDFGLHLTKKDGLFVSVSYIRAYLKKLSAPTYINSDSAPTFLVANTDPLVIRFIDPRGSTVAIIDVI